jgi:hypothetical protein
LELPPQETRVRLPHTPSTTTKMRLFKRQAPNDMKKEDLIAKCWIIADPELLLRSDAPGMKPSLNDVFRSLLRIVENSDFCISAAA